VSWWKATLAALVSLVLPGLGHAVAGAPRRALAIALLALASQALFMVVQATDEVTPDLLRLAALWMVVMVAATLAVAADAWRLARAPDPGRGGWRRVLPLAALVVVLNLGLVLLPGEPVTWRSFYAPSGSMLPTLRPADRFIVQEGWYAAHPLRRGDVVVFTLPPAEDAYVKRIYGLAGDRLRMAGGVLLLNGEPVPVEVDGTSRRWTLPHGPRVAVLKLRDDGAANNTTEFLVPAGHVFVMGDNLDDSYDSRLDPRMRYVPVSALVGRAAIIYWPLHTARFATAIR